MDLTLKHPLVFDKTTITKLTFRDYTVAADYLAFDLRGGVSQRIALVSSLTGMDEAIIKKLRGYDWRKAEQMSDKLLEADEDIIGESDPAKKSEGS